MNVLVITVCLLIAIILGFWLYLRYLLTNENPIFWEKKVRRIESSYRDDYPKDRVLFVGSSSIEYWKTLEQDMYPIKVLNHGIAGTKITDFTYYYKRLIIPFNPKAIVFYAGSNDINGIKGNSKTAEEVYQLTVSFFSEVQDRLPRVPVYYLSISPSKMRYKVWKDADKANQLIKEYCQKNGNLRFIDATAFLLAPNGRPKPDIFRYDGLHFNKEGYRIWSSIIKPILSEGQ